MAVLTISREFGSGGKKIGSFVSEALGYDYVDKERILSDLRREGPKWEQWGKDLDEHSPSLWEKYDWSFRGFGALIQSTLLNYALNNNVVIVGRGGSFLVHGIVYALRIRIVAPIDSRIARIMARESVSEESARWMIDKADKERAGFIYSLYGRRVDDPKEYDTVFSTGSQSEEKVADIVKGLLEERDRLYSEEARSELQMRAMAARIRAGLLTDPRFLIPTLDVGYEGSTLVLRGIIHNPKEHRRVEEAAKALAGDTPLKCELHYRG